MTPILGLIGSLFCVHFYFKLQTSSKARKCSHTLEISRFQRFSRKRYLKGINSRFVQLYSRDSGFWDVAQKCVKKTGQWSSSPFRAKYPRVLNLNTSKPRDDPTCDLTELVWTPCITWAVEVIRGVHIDVKKWYRKGIMQPSSWVTVLSSPSNSKGTVYKDLNLEDRVLVVLFALF